MASIYQLLAIMARLRDPESGCPWDRAQDFRSIVPHTLEEAYEVADAIERERLDELPDELGDLLFQVVFYARLGEEAGRFGFDDVVDAICDKLVRRHPHVFGHAQVESVPAQAEAWEAYKARERGGKAEASVLDGVIRGLPALSRAAKLQRRAARAGFDWPDAGGVLDKIEEEAQEVRTELDGGDAQRLGHEVGDLLFACVNLARHAGQDPEQALRDANGRFESRFRRLEQGLRHQGKSPREMDLATLEALWQQAKEEERT